MKKYIDPNTNYSSFQLSKLSGVSLPTLTSWIEKGYIMATSTGEGRGRRHKINGADFIAFLKTPRAGKHQITDCEGEVKEVPDLNGRDPFEQPVGMNEPGVTKANAEPKPAPAREAAVSIGGAKPRREKVAIEKIVQQEDCQVRASLNEQVVREYSEAMIRGAIFPPLIVFRRDDSSEYLLADGFHRVKAALKNGEKTIEVEVHRGGKTDALKFALGANATHGHRRTSKDKRRAIELAAREFPTASSSRIAKICDVSEGSVRNHREQGGEKVMGADGKMQAARKKRPPTYRRAKSAITRLRPSKEDAIKLINWLRNHYQLVDEEVMSS